ncbi:MAG: M23 family metallopeptidase [Myxococcota bacterium]
MSESRRSGTPEVVTLMYVPGPAGNIRRFNLRRVWLRRGVAVGAVALLSTLALSVDYVRLRSERRELVRLRAETGKQREQIEDYAELMEAISVKLTDVSRLDRKLRVITNLDPADELPLPGIGGIEGELLEPTELMLHSGRRHRQMIKGLTALSEAAEAEVASLGGLIQHLEDQSARLVATPSIAPTKGWVTSAFGYRRSPFTGNREFHRGVDIAGRTGTPIVAPADGDVRFAGQQRALGNAIVIKHGYGVETIYGHLSEILVRRGQRVKRGDRIALMGTTGRSTGPHLHYQVEVNGSAKNPLNYILD